MSQIVCALFLKSLPGSVPLQELAEACLRFTPRVAVRTGDAVFLDVDPVPLLRLQNICQRFFHTPQIGVGFSPGRALCHARWGECDPRKLPLNAFLDFVDPFKTLEPESEKLAHRLCSLLGELGLKTLADFGTLPESSLSSRFGKEALEWHRRVREIAPMPWPGFTPTEVIAERRTIQDPETLSGTTSAEILLFALKSALDQIMARLRGRCKRLTSFEIELRLENKSTLKHIFNLPTPQGSVRELLPLLREKIYSEFQLRPLSAPIIGTQILVLNTTPSHGAQKDFFDRSEEERGSWGALIARLSQKLGKESTFMAVPVERYLPEKAWEPVHDVPLPDIPVRLATTSPSAEAAFSQSRGVITFSSHAGQATAHDVLHSQEHSKEILPYPVLRPSRLLKRPEPLRRQGKILYRRGQSLEIIEWIGPERISGEWWMDPQGQGFARDYYQVRTASGNLLWIFTGVPTSQNPIFYLHGFFD